MTHDTPCFIAHRGYPALYPENSLTGIQAAIRIGARYVEIDIQLSRQLTPFLCHDDDLRRLIRRSIYLTGLDDDEIDTLTVPYPDSANSDTSTKAAPISRLSEFCRQLARWPHVTAFIEIKPESILRFGIPQTVEAVLPIVHPVREQCIMISFDWQSMALLRARGMPRIGWIIEHWTEAQRAIALRLKPDYLFCGIRRLPEKLDELWPGPWQWVIYTVDDHEAALRYATAGITLIETDTIGTMLQSVNQDTR